MDKAEAKEKPISPLRRFWLPLTAAAVLIVAAVTVLLLMPPAEARPDVPTSAEKIEKTEEPTVKAPEAVLATRFEMGKDVTPGEGWAQRADTVLKTAYDAGFNAIFFPLTGANGNDSDTLLSLVPMAHERAMLVYVAVDPLLTSAGGQYDLTDPRSVHSAGSALADLCARHGADGILLTPSEPEDGNPSYVSYAAEGGSMGYDAYRRSMLGRFLIAVAKEIRTSGGGVCVGACLPDDRLSEGTVWAEGMDFLVVDALTPTPAFTDTAAAWRAAFAEKQPLYFRIPVSDATLGGKELAARCQALVDAGQKGFLFDDTAVFMSGREDLAPLRTLIGGLTDEEYGIRTLTLQSPASRQFTTYVDSVSFIGSSDPNFPLTLNGQEVERSETGYFSLDCHLEEGRNVFTFSHKDSETTCTVTYKNVLIRSIYPDKETLCDGGTRITVSVVAKNGSIVNARLGEQVVTMTAGDPASANAAETFTSYAATFVLPEATDLPTRVGELIVTATKGERTETKAGGAIVVRAKPAPTPDVSETASAAYESGYGIRVGEGNRTVAEVVSLQTETMDIITPTDERSRPTNAYLPQGTVDYCTEPEDFRSPDSGKRYQFRNLAYGKRVYSDSNIRVFKAILPETNTVTAVEAVDDGRHTKLTFDVMWKAPFKVTLDPQTYENPYPRSGRPKYDVEQTTYTHLDIEFCYTVSGQGKIDLTGNPVFRSAEWIKADSGNYVLRLWLTVPGQFCGWTASYNEDNQLVFSFLDPYVVKDAENAYGASLEGAVIVLDPGHGGVDPGAIGASKTYTEAVLNLILARKIQRELESLGATVVLTRNDDCESLPDHELYLQDRFNLTTQTKPDLFISVHRNASSYSSGKGYENYYFHPFSKALADAIDARVRPNAFGTGLGTDYYPYHVCRVSCCPAVLTENGYVSNSGELERLKTDEHNDLVARETVRGIIDYFRSLKTGEQPSE